MLSHKNIPLSFQIHEKGGSFSVLKTVNIWTCTTVTFLFLKPIVFRKFYPNYSVNDLLNDCYLILNINMTPFKGDFLFCYQSIVDCLHLMKNG